MKVYFYGATEKAAKKKCKTFITQLEKMQHPDGKRYEGKSLNASMSAVVLPKFVGSPLFPIPSAYRCQFYVEYNFSVE